MTLPYRNSPRLKTFDYSSGWFFITICAFEHREIFGKIIRDEVALSPAGEIIHEEWLKTGELRKDVDLDAFVIMPNHFHAILALSGIRAGHRPAPTTSLPKVMAQFKSVTAKRIGGEVWQRSYYDHIIRDEADLYRIREYIQNNPLKWQLDRENPARVGEDPQEDLWFK